MAKESVIRRLAALVAVFLLGLMIAQLIGTIQVYRSNIKLLRTMELLDQVGYLTIPNSGALAPLAAFKAAFWGGTFFTFTVGAFITLCSISMAVVFCCLPHLSLRFWLGPLLLLALTLAWVNLNGFNPAASAYLLCIPPAVIGLTVKLTPRSSANTVFILVAGHLIAFAVMGLIGYHRITVASFIQFRNTVLMPDARGQKAIDFYYRYTLYPAQAFKSLEQKTLKVCRVMVPPSANDYQRLIQTLLRHDYLVLNQAPFSDVDIYVRDEQLLFTVNERQVSGVPIVSFFSDARNALKAYAAAVDRNRAFRSLTFFSLLAALGILPYLMACTLINAGLNLLLRSKTIAAVVSPAVCLIGGLALIMLLPSGPNTTEPAAIDEAAIQHGLAATDQATRWRTLSLLAARDVDISRFKGYEALLTSPELTDRYLMARILEHSSPRVAIKHLSVLLDDPHPFIAYNAYKALGRFHDRALIPPVIERIKASDHWYVQMYAYQALKKLGWRQTELRISATAFQ